MALPFRNWPFTYLVGLIYFVYAWSFVAADPRQSPIVEKQAQAISAEIQRASNEFSNHEGEAKRLRGLATTLAEQAKTHPSLLPEAEKYEKLAVREVGAAELERAALAAAKRRDAELQPMLYMQLDALTHDTSLVKVGDKMKATARTSLGFLLDIKALMTAAEQSPMFAFMRIGLWAALVHYVESKSKLIKFILGTLHAVAHVAVLLFVCWFAQASGVALGSLGLMALFPALPGNLGTSLLPHLLTEGSVAPDLFRILWNVIVTLFVGGLLGGFVMGIYWTLTSTLLNMHTGDAFGALGIKDYKNFLRIKLEPDRATIFPIKIDVAGLSS